MTKDMFGADRLKINLHMHTTCSDGRKTLEEAAEIYKKEGYDVVAITDHWAFRKGEALCGLRTISGAEYNIGGGNACDGVFHILGLGCSSEPQLNAEHKAQEIIDEIHRCGGLAILAHPAWSLNTVQQTAALHGIDGTEIYNSVSDAGESARPYSGDFVDIAACAGQYYPLIADDDTHYYDGSDDTKAWIMLEASQDASDEELLEAIRQGKYYATQGPEVHISRKGDQITVQCSPVSRIAFFSNAVWSQGHCHRVEGLTQASCTVQPWETFIRAEVTDAQGRMAWSQILVL